MVLGNMGKGCPATHPVQLPMIFWEIYWQVDLFADDWVEDNKTQPFVWANGDPCVGFEKFRRWC